MYLYLCCFLIMSFVSWIFEVGYAQIIEKRFVNRGFLSGPFCPIYGIGLVIIDLALLRFRENLFVLFFGAMLLGSALEWGAGFLLEKLFNQKWWDYTDEPYNLNGYICLSFSFVWGFAGALVERLIMPFFRRVIPVPPGTVGIVIVSIFAAVFLVDLIISIISALGLNKNLKAIDAVSQGIRDSADFIGKAVSDSVFDVQEKYNESEIKEHYEEIRDKGQKELDELKQKYLAQLDKLKSSSRQMRLIKAFPDVKLLKYSEQLAEIRKSLSIKSSEVMRRRSQLAETAYSPAESEELLFAAGVSPIKILWIFFMAHICGIAVRLIDLLVHGMDINAANMGFQPFYGIGITLLTICLYRLYDKRDRWVFLTGALYCFVFMLIVDLLQSAVTGGIDPGKIFSYIDLPNDIGIAVIGGIGSIFWIKDVYPRISAAIEKIPQNLGRALTVLFSLVLCLHLAMALELIHI